MAPVRYIARLLNRSLKSPTQLSHKRGEALTSIEIGDLGEQIARDFLRHQGCKILYQNYRAVKGGEVDIIAREKNTLLFIEVKTRTQDTIGRPLDAVTDTKQHLISKGANEWLRKLDRPEIRYRFDVIEIVLSETSPPLINQVRNAF